MLGSPVNWLRRLLPLWIIPLFWWCITLQERPENECMEIKFSRFCKSENVFILFLCLIWSLVDKEFYVENHFNSEIWRHCSIVFWLSVLLTVKAKAITFSCQGAFGVFSIFFWNFMVIYLCSLKIHFLLVRLSFWRHFSSGEFSYMVSSLLFETFTSKVLWGRFLYWSVKFLVFLSQFLSSYLSTLLLGDFFNIIFGWIFISVFISAIIFLISRSLLFFFIISCFQPSVSTVFTEVPKDLEAGASLTVSQENEHLFCTRGRTRRMEKASFTSCEGYAFCSSVYFLIPHRIILGSLFCIYFIKLKLTSCNLCNSI